VEVGIGLRQGATLPDPVILDLRSSREACLYKCRYVSVAWNSPFRHR
jgi:hypothetical protein